MLRLNRSVHRYRAIRNDQAVLRRRIREIAASLNLSDIQIGPALKLKHFAIAGFVEEHSVNIEWLLEGRGDVFKTVR